MIDFATIFTALNPLILVKLAVLLLVFVYIVFAVIVVVQARAFNRIIYIGDSFESIFIQGLAIFHLIVTIFLFLLALAIL